METKVTNIIISGVGGQGIILAGRILAKCALDSGFDVKANELHGMAQRGGSVLSHIRFGRKVNSPLIPEGEADFLVAMEELESLRYERLLKPGASIILNTRKIMPAGVEEKDYPKDIQEQLKKSGFIVLPIDAQGIAKQAGSIKVENVVLMGLLSKFLPFKQEIWQTVLKEAVPEKYLEMNITAFNKGKS